MKRILLVNLILSLIIFQNCQPLTSMYIETAVPAEINFPGNYNKIVFINLENDLNDDNETDTLLYNMITSEMSLGFMNSIQNSFGVDTSRFLYLKGFPKKDILYYNDTISWAYLDVLSKDSNADIFVVLDSMDLSMNTEKFTDFYAYPVEYFQYREIAIKAYWSVYDYIEKKKLDAYLYHDTLYWESSSYLESEAGSNLPSAERAIRETVYFAAADYADRILPGWQRETRYYFISGNKDFKIAAELAKDGEWDRASEIWEKYVNNIDKEIASRAAFNLALASEINGRYIKAIGWAERSNLIKPKKRTLYYINRLKKRQAQFEKIQEQIY